MRQILQRWIVSRRLSPTTQAGVALGLVGLAGLARWGVSGIFGGALPFLTFFPTILITTVLTGRTGAVVSLAASCVLSALFAPKLGALSPAGSMVAGACLMALFGGFIAWVALLLRETLEQLHETSEQERLLLLELQHRVKNSLAIVQSIAAQSFGASVSVAEKRLFTDRLVALGEVHNLLSDQGWGPVPLRQLAERALAPFAPPGGGRIALAGEEVWLRADLVVNLGLYLHELATNAVKYGALSNDTGRIELRWITSPTTNGEALQLVWTELGGPPVRKGARNGLGMRLLQRGLGGKPESPEAVLEFRPEGVRWSFTVLLHSDRSPHGRPAPRTEAAPGRKPLRAIRAAP